MELKVTQIKGNLHGLTPFKGMNFLWIPFALFCVSGV